MPLPSSCYIVVENYIIITESQTSLFKSKLEKYWSKFNGSLTEILESSLLITSIQIAEQVGSIGTQNVSHFVVIEV